MPVPIVCAACGQSFNVKPTKAAEARYCSMVCRRRRVTLTCEWCKRQFETFASRGHQRFCSPACRQRAKSGDVFQRVYELLDRSGGPDACWPFMGGRDNDGYGVLKFRSQVHKAHRVMFEQANGSIVPGLPVCHDCDNPPCGNPAHLWQGTNAENVADMDAKGRRGKRGKRHPSPPQ